MTPAPQCKVSRVNRHSNTQSLYLESLRQATGAAYGQNVLTRAILIVPKVHIFYTSIVGIHPLLEYAESIRAINPVFERDAGHLVELGTFL